MSSSNSVSNVLKCGCWGVQTEDLAELQAKYPDYELVFYANTNRYGCNYVLFYKDGSLYGEKDVYTGPTTTTKVLKRIIKLSRNNLIFEDHSGGVMSYDAIRWYKRELKTRQNKENRSE